MIKTSTKEISIAIGSDHGGYSLKELLKDHLTQSGYQVTDCGTYSSESVDYPHFAYEVAKKVSDGCVDLGVMIDGAGIGSAMVANKVKGVRAALCYDLSTARNAREHNNANLLTLGAGLVGPELAKEIVDTFLRHECTVERHLQRTEMIDEIECPQFTGFESENEEQSMFKDEVVEGITKEDIERIAERVGELVMFRESGRNGNGSHCKTDMVCVCGVCVEKKPETIRQFLNFGVDRIGYHNGTGCECVPEDIARCIDHTLLKPDATDDDIIKLCAEAREFQFATVCVSPSFVQIAARELAGSPVKVCTVVGFPSGAHMPEIKAMEARRAIRDGAKEIDMVINIGALKSGNDDLVYRDIRLVCEACEDGGAKSKVIIETAYLTDDEKVRACELAKRAHANYVKTSTGFGPEGATAEDVALMRSTVGHAGIGVKAAGGIKSYEDAQKMISAGATRIGASAGIKILQQAKTLTISN
ncbi:MAG: deoxyribose-phosphate aldolase [Candidatus Marinimicrobia bacterium]|nr:deoxyribose-phosphate aldolase [Candidatus Neomarinimicrobiota bacterium]